jgi:hypothetical protein
MRLDFRAFIPLLALIAASLACVQDCMMTGATIAGVVRDSAGEPVANAEIYIENDPIDFSTPVRRTLYTDEEGRFGPESVSYFMCENVSFTVTADGFEPQTVSYILDQGLRNSLPNQIQITLERSE